MEMQWLFTLLNILYWAVAYPLLLVIYWILVLLYWIASPLIYLGHFIVQVGSLPISVLAKLEVRLLFDMACQILMYIFSDTLYLFWGRNRRWTDDRSDTPLAVKD
jgi:hypothetical protein